MNFPRPDGPCVKSVATLGGFGAFRRVTSSGRRIDGTVLGCYYRVDDTTPGVLTVGVTVRDRTLKAVRRNYLKRIMRETFRASCDPLVMKVAESRKGIEVVIFFRKSHRLSPPSRRLEFSAVRDNMLKIVEQIASRL